MINTINQSNMNNSKGIKNNSIKSGDKSNIKEIENDIKNVKIEYRTIIDTKKNNNHKRVVSIDNRKEKDKENKNICSSFNNICPCNSYCYNNECHIYDFCFNCPCYKLYECETTVDDDNKKYKYLFNKNEENFPLKDNINNIDEKNNII